MTASTSKPAIVQRGQIWDVKFDPQVGSEIAKIRPAVVMNIPAVGRLPLHIVVPITTGNPNFSKFLWMLPIIKDTRNGLDQDSFADAFQVKSIAAERFVKQRGVLGQRELDELATIIAYCVGYKPPKL
jgi:mRNA interferase MazF